MAKKLKWNDSEEVVVKYAQKDSHGVDINISGLNSAITSKLNSAPDGTNNLITAGGKINTSYLPDAILGQLLYGGTVRKATSSDSALTNHDYDGILTLSTLAKEKLNTTDNQKVAKPGNYNTFEGMYFIASENCALFQDGMSALILLNVGDWLLSTGSSWEKVDNTDAVITVQIKGTANVVSSSTGTIQSGIVSTTIGLVAGHGDTVNPYAAKNPHYFLAGPDSGSSSEVPAFRGITKADLPALTASDVGAMPANATVVTSTKTLNTNNTTGQTASASEAISGSGTINLHKVSKTGDYNDLLNKPTIPSVAYPVSDVIIKTASNAGSSILTGTVANIVTGSVYNPSSNKIATINDIAFNIPITVEDFTIQ